MPKFHNCSPTTTIKRIGPERTLALVDEALAGATREEIRKRYDVSKDVARRILRDALGQPRSQGGGPRTKAMERLVLQAIWKARRDEFKAYCDTVCGKPPTPTPEAAR